MLKGSVLAVEILEIAAFSECQQYLEAWRGLLAESEDYSIYQTPEWMEIWWQCYGGDARLMLLLAVEEGRLAGIAPLMISRRRMNGVRERVVEFIGAPNFASDYCDFIIAASRGEVLERLLDRLFADSSWTVLLLSNFPTHSPNYVRFMAYRDRIGLPFLMRRTLEAPTCVLRDPGENEKLLSKKSLRRHFNYFQKNGQLSCRHCETFSEIERLLPVFFKQHIERWSETSFPSLFRDPAACEFYRLAAERLFRAGWLRFSVVQYNKEPIAFHFGFEHGGRFIWYKPSFDPAYAKRSPGEVLLKFLLEYAVGKGLAEFDFTVGGEPFKHRFANLIRTNAEAVIYRSRLGYGLMLARKKLSAAASWLFGKNPLRNRVAAAQFPQQA